MIKSSIITEYTPARLPPHALSAHHPLPSGPSPGGRGGGRGAPRRRPAHRSGGGGRRHPQDTGACGLRGDAGVREERAVVAGRVETQSAAQRPGGGALVAGPDGRRGQSHAVRTPQTAASGPRPHGSGAGAPAGGGGTRR